MPGKKRKRVNSRAFFIKSNFLKYLKTYAKYDIVLSNTFAYPLNDHFASIYILFSQEQDTTLP